MKKIFLFLAGVITIPFFVYHGNQSLKENQLTNLKDEIYKSIDSIDKIIVDCNEELNAFIREVVPKTNHNDKVIDLDTPTIFSEFLQYL